MDQKFSGKGFYLIVSASFFFALMGAGVKVAGKTIPVYEIVFFRALVGSIILWIIASVRNTNILGNNKKMLLTRGMLGFCAISCYFFSITRLPLADAALLSYTSPIFVAILSVFLLKERITIQLGIFIAIAFICIYFILKPGFDIINIGGIAAVCSGFFASLVFILVKKLETESFLTIIFYFTIVTTCLSAPFMLSNYVKPEPVVMLILILNGILATLAQIFLTIAILIEKVSSTTALTCLAVIFSYLLGLIFWGETLDITSMIAGAILIISSIIYSKNNLTSRRR